MPIANEDIKEIAQIIIDATSLTHVDINELSDDSFLGTEPLDLDSIDILEVIAAIEDKYKVKIADAKEGAKHFQSLKTIHNFVTSK
jgi:acyl carrier protein